MFQADNCCGDQWHLPVGHLEENLFVTEAHNDPSLQPVVMMKRLDDAQYATTVKFDTVNEKFQHLILALYTVIHN